MKIRIALFGPPAAGKSTLVTAAIKQGIEAYDMEESTSEERKSDLQRRIQEEQTDLVIYGTADLQPDDFPEDTACVLLLLTPKEDYLKRLNQRDTEMPSKVGQVGGDTYDRFEEWTDPFDIVFKENLSAEDTLEEVIRLAKQSKLQKD